MPPVLPVVRFTPLDDEQMEVAVDGQVWASGPIDRQAFGRVVDQILAERRVPVRVELTETDGRSYVDIVTPGARRTRTASSSVPRPQTEDRGDEEWREARGEGFLPGEDVAVAIVTRCVSADQTGNVRSVIDPAELPDGHTGVLLFGFISGTLVHDRLAP